MKEKRSQQFLKRRKLMVMLPVLTIPFICALFWLVKGSSDAMAQGKDGQSGKGLNTELPDAQLKDKGGDKLSFYNQAENDSLVLQEQIRNDPYYTNPDSFPFAGMKVYTDPNEEKINQRIAMLTEQLNQPSYSAANQGYYSGATTGSNDIRKLDAMMQAMNQGTGEDPEMLQLNSMLDKLLDLQHPGRANARLKEQSLKNKKQVYPVNAIKRDKTIELLNSNTSVSAAGFYEWSVHSTGDTIADNAVEAIVAETRVLTTGTTIKLKLLDDILIAGILIPAGEFVYGHCSVDDDRLSVNINSVRYKKSLYTISLDVYDNDGIKGIYVPGAITRDVAKNAASEAVQGVDLYTMSNSIGVQAATAGVNAAKTLVSKKARLIKVTVKSGYKVFLKNKNEQD